MLTETTTVVKQETHVRVVREWCVSLGVLTAVSISRQEAEMKLAAYVPMLMREFPDGAFTTESLQHVARQCAKGFPTYPELANHLSAWWRPRRPVIALPPPPPPAWREEPTEEEREYVRQVAAKAIAAIRSSAQALDEQREKLWQAQEHRARYLSPAELDRINPLPGGRKRVVQSATIAEAAANDEDEPPPAAA